jgi:F0F1-type ATP synthase assembly protein I
MFLEDKKGQQQTGQRNNFKIFYAVSFAWQLGFLIAVPLGIFLFLGLLLDKHLKTNPLFLIAGGVVALIATFYEVYQWLETIVKKGND